MSSRTYKLLESYPFPTIPAYPRDASACNKQAFADFVDGDDNVETVNEFNHMAELNSYAYLKWSVINETDLFMVRSILMDCLGGLASDFV